MKELERQLSLLKSEVTARDATIRDLESALHLERSYTQPSGGFTAAGNTEAVVTARFEGILASKDSIIRDLESKMAKNITDYADLVSAVPSIRG